MHLPNSLAATHDLYTSIKSIHLLTSITYMYMYMYNIHNLQTTHVHVHVPLINHEDCILGTNTYFYATALQVQFQFNGVTDPSNNVG